VAATADGRRATVRHQETQTRIRARALRHLLRLWSIVRVTDLEHTIGTWADTAAVVTHQAREESAEAAAKYLAELRAAEGVAGTITVLTGDGPPHELVVRNLRGAALSGIIRARRRGATIEAAARAGFTRAAGTASNLVLGGGREVLAEAVDGDDQVIGWIRVTSGKACSWCAMLSSRGPVYGSARTGFASHDHCNCSIEPVYRAEVADNPDLWPGQAGVYRRIWDHMVKGSATEDRGALAAFEEGLEAFRRGEPLPNPTVQSL
jgi:ribosomal protein S11